jgi:N-methylhydantoinase A
MFGAELARALRIPEVIVPPNPGAFSSFGMLMADARRDLGRTFLHVLSESSVDEARGSLKSIAAQLTAEMAEEFDVSSISFEYEADMRYPSQSHTVRVRLPGDLTAAATRAAFEATYQQRYGHINASLAPQFIVLRVTGRVPTARPSLEIAIAIGGAVAPRSRRSVYCRRARRRIDTPLYRRTDLPVGFSLTGPAIVEEYSSTTIVPLGDRLEVGALGELRITVQPAGSEVTV